MLKPTQTRLTPARLALFYVLIAGVWVAASSELLFIEFESTVAITGFELLKGLGFVLASGALIYFIARRMLDRLLRSEESLRQSEAERILLHRQLAQAQKLEALGRLAAGIIALRSAVAPSALIPRLGLRPYAENGEVVVHFAHDVPHCRNGMVRTIGEKSP